MRRACFSSVLLGLAIAGCGDDSGGTGTDTSNASTTDPTTGTAPTTAGTTAGTTGTTNAATTSEPTTSTTSDPTTETEGDETSSTTGEPLDCPYTPIEGQQQVGLELVASGFSRALFAIGDPVDTDVVYVLQQTGQIKRLAQGVTEAPDEDWFSLPVSASFEEGLLGMAFHPDYAANGLIYLLHSPSDDRWYITEYQVVDGNVDEDSARNVFATAQFAGNHNGGMIQFGPDGMLYISTGDGGGGNDTCNTGQNLETHLGKILRIDVAGDGNADSTTTCGSGSGACNNCVSLNDFDYTVPKDNPFVDDPEVDDAIYAYGMRNPWRFAFDYETERLYAADVGQGGWEEIDSIVAGGNYGWSTMEGNHCFGGNPCDTSAAPGEANSAGMIAPIAEYARSGGRCSVTGLGVYRSCEVPGFAGLYFYADLCSGEVFAVNYDGTTSEVLGPVTTIPNNQGAFGGGYNAYGDVFIVSGNYTLGGPGSVYRITAAK